MRIRQPVMTDGVMVKLPYVTTFGMTDPNGLRQVRQFRGNSVFDPDYAIGGTSALGLDQWSAFYDRYEVIGSTIKWTVLQRNTDPTEPPCKVAITDIRTSQGFTNMNEVLENRRSTNKILMQTQSKPWTSSKYMSTKRAFDVVGPLGAQQSLFGAPFSDNPQIGWNWYLTAESIGVGPMDLVFEVRVTYYCRLTRRDILIES